MLHCNLDDSQKLVKTTPVSQLANDSLILIDKPRGMTSFGVVARLRTMLSKQLGHKAKVGHTGTLDPFATGLMLLVTGKMCKQAASYTKLDKVYRAKFVLGAVSSTADPEGRIRHSNRQRPSLNTLEAALSRFQGLIWQTPPVFSAIKISGKRAYQLARQGENVEIPRRQVKIYDLKLISYCYPRLEIEVHVSSGTYIRSLAVDLGRVLGSGAYCQQLRRLSIAEYHLDQALKISEIIA